MAQNRLFVGNIPFTASETDLRNFFSSGSRKILSVKIITDRETGQSRGFGFVELETAADVATAVSEFDGIQMDGRAIHVSEAKERESRSGGGGSGRGNRDEGRGGRGGRDSEGEGWNRGKRRESRRR
jgi:RNA recognition motif-containing protein